MLSVWFCRVLQSSYVVNFLHFQLPRTYNVSIEGSYVMGLYQQFWSANSKKRIVCIAPIGNSLRMKRLVPGSGPAKNKSNAVNFGFRTFLGFFQRKIVFKPNTDADFFQKRYLFMVYLLRIVQFFMNYAIGCDLRSIVQNRTITLYQIPWLVCGEFRQVHDKIGLVRW